MNTLTKTPTPPPVNITGQNDYAGSPAVCQSSPGRPSPGQGVANFDGAFGAEVTKAVNRLRDFYPECEADLRITVLPSGRTLYFAARSRPGRMFDYESDFGDSPMEAVERLIKRVGHYSPAQSARREIERLRQQIARIEAQDGQVTPRKR